MPIECVQFSLKEFVEKGESFYNEEDVSDLIRFILCGQYYREPGVLIQATINPILNRVRRQQAEALTALRDYDSLIGLCRDLVITRQLHLYPIANPADNLKESIHINYTISVNDVREQSFIHVF